MNDRTFKLAAASVIFLLVGGIFTIGGTYDLTVGPNGPHSGAFEVATGGISMFLSVLMAIWAAASHIEIVIARSHDSSAPTDTSSQ